MVGDLDLIPLINELSHHIQTIQKYIYKIQKEEVELAIENIEYFIEKKKQTKIKLRFIICQIGLKKAYL